MFSTKSLVLATAFIATSMIASATTVSCGSQTVGGGSGTVSPSTQSFSLACGGFAITGPYSGLTIRVELKNDYLFGNSPTNSTVGLFKNDTVNNGTLSFANDFITTSGAPDSGTYVDSLGGSLQPSNYFFVNVAGAPTSGIAGFTQAAFNVLVTYCANGTTCTDGVTSITSTGSVTGVADGAKLTYSYSVPSSVPEPATFGMIGGGLLALAAFARRRNA
jgi:hypothetical protein